MGVWARIRAWAGSLLARGAGPRGEAEAERLLTRLGYRILGRNIRFAFGEIDLLAEDGPVIVVVEVKARRRDPSSPVASQRTRPEASITRRKARKLVRLMDAVCRANGWQSRPKRIDVVAVDFHTDGRTDVRHFKAAVGR